MSAQAAPPMAESAVMTADIATSIRRALAWFETLTPATLDDIATIYADDAHFRDPFNDLHGLTALTRVYRQMFDTLEQPRFTIIDRVIDGTQVFVTWDFTFRLRSDRAARPRVIHGGTLLRMNLDGRIREHLDYWDAAGQLYETLPLLGSLLRWLRGKLAV